MFLTIFIDPGVQLTKSMVKQKNEYLKEELHDEIQLSMDEKDLHENNADQSTEKPKNWCKGCEHVKMDLKTRHCVVCKVCVQDYDHHCGVLGVCIGKGNLNSPYLFVINTMLFVFFNLISSKQE